MSRVLKAGLITIACAFALGPVAFMVVASLNRGTALSMDVQGFSLHAYRSVLSSSQVLDSMLTTLWISTLASIVTILLAVPAAYSFARSHSRLLVVMSNSLILAWLLPQVFIALAFFSLAVQMKVYGKPMVIVFFGVLQAVPLSVWVLRSYFQSVPIEIDEAAALDGASMLAFMRKILLPIAAPSIAAVGGYSFLMTWQLYLYPLVYLAGGDHQMASVQVANFSGQWSTNYPQMMAFSTLITLPLIAVFLAVQKYIVSGLGAGSVNA